MKYFASLCALLLAGSMPGFASVHSTGPNPENQFHFKPTGRRVTKAARLEAAREAHRVSVRQMRGPKNTSAVVHAHPASAKKIHRNTANPPTGKLGFASAVDVPAGGVPYSSDYIAVPGDFNGDKKTDIATVVESYDTNTLSYVYAISVVLSNGDGTFKAPVLTPTANGDPCPYLVVGDMNGDGKSDLVVAHQPGQCGNSYTIPTFDVLLSNGDGTFTTSGNTNNTVSAAGLSGGTVADVNGDGKLDVIVVDDGNPGNVWTLLGNGDGTFKAPTSVALGGQLGGSVVIADLNGDGLLDITANDPNTNELTVYLATSASTYAAAAQYTTSDGNYYGCSTTLGDLSGDGKPEIVSSNCSNSGNDITVYVNNGDGTFATGVYYDGAVSGGATSGAADVYTNAVAIADVNGDGKADIIATNDYSGDVTILFGNGDGTVNVPTFGYATGGYPVVPAIVADFNGDGFADLIVLDDVSSLVYLKGYGDGTFRAALDYYAAADTFANSYAVASGDFNGDGYADFVVGNSCYSCTNPLGITVFLSNPDGSYQPGVTYGSSSSMWFAAVADFNGDGKLDIAATDYNAGTVQIFNGDGTGNFTAGPTFNTDLASANPYGVFVADFNKDGHPDLAIANYGSDISILLNDGTGNFQAPIPIPLNGYVWQGVAIADLGNGTLDIVAPFWSGSDVAVLIGNGDGTFQPEQDLPLGTGYELDAVALGDFNGDKKLDMAVTMNGGSGQDIAIALGNGDGTFGTFSIVPSSLQNLNLVTSPYPQNIQAADIDGDGNVDLVYANERYGTVGVLFGQGNGSFYDPVEYPVGGYAWGLLVADVNGDGAPDVITADSDFAGATVLLNANGTGTFGSYTIGSSAQGATITAGQSATFTLTITPSNHYNGTVAFTCPSGLPQLATCTFSPSSVTLDGLTPVTVKLTVTTTAPTASLQIPVGINPHGNSHSTMLLASLNGMGVFGMILAGSFRTKRNPWSALGILALAMCFFLVGCGGSGSTPTTNPPPTKANTTSSVSSSAATVLIGQPVTFTGKVSASSGTPTGTVTFLDGTTKLGMGTLSNGSAAFQTSSLAAGVHNVTVAYSGDSNFDASTSTALNQTVDKLGTAAGNYSVTVTATGTAGTNGVGKPNQSINLSVVVQ